MQHTLRYRSSRGEVWYWYWKAWRAKYWKSHTILALMLSVLMPDLTVGGSHYAGRAVWFVVLLPVITSFFAIFPQIMFKNAERVLTVDSRGWSTQIGDKTGARTWAEVASIKEESGSVIITSANGNALIIPESAFSGLPAKQQFVADAQKWKESYAG